MLPNTKIEILLEKRLYKFLCEETGINNIVIGWSHMVVDMLKAYIRTSKSLPINRDYVTYKKGNFNILLNNVRLPVNWEYYNFMDQQTLKDNQDLLKGNIAYMWKNGLNIKVHSVNNQYSIDALYDSVGHELLHLFQAHKTKKIFSNTELYKNADIWKNDQNIYLSQIGIIIYLSNKFEQDAFNHGLYMSLSKSYDLEQMDEIFRNSSLYCALMELTKSVENLKTADKNDANVQQAIQVLQPYMSFEKMLGFGDEAINRMNRMLARTYAKAKKDWENENIIDVAEKFNREKEKERTKLYEKVLKDFDIDNKLLKNGGVKFS